MNLLKKRIVEGRLVAAICASPVIVLANEGLLSGVKEATCHPSLLAQIDPQANEKFMRGGYPIIDPVVQCGHIVTSRGPGTSMAFSLHLVKVLFSPEKELEVR